MQMFQMSAHLQGTSTAAGSWALSRCQSPASLLQLSFQSHLYASLLPPPCHEVGLTWGNLSPPTFQTW